jgi:hypothetical protein
MDGLSDAGACPRRDPFPDGNGNGDAVGLERTGFREATGEKGGGRYRFARFRARGIGEGDERAVRDRFLVR